MTDRGECIKQLMPARRPELTGATAEEEAAGAVGHRSVSSRGALARTLIAQAWPLARAASLQRLKWPTHLQVSRLNAAARQLVSFPEKIAFPSTAPTDEIDMRSDSDNWRLTSDSEDEEKGAGVRGANLLRRGRARDADHRPPAK